MRNVPQEVTLKFIGRVIVHMVRDMFKPRKSNLSIIRDKKGRFKSQTYATSKASRLKSKQYITKPMQLQRPETQPRYVRLYQHGFKPVLLRLE